MNKRAGRTELRAKYIAVAVAAAFAPWSAYGQTPPPANQLPNLTVTQGSGQVNAPVGNFLQVDQFSQRAIFSGSMTMGSAGHMNVSQPGSAAIGLFRDVSGSLTQIFGRITANGQIFISNQNGVLFGSTARVEVGGLFATSLSTSDADFMAGNRNLVWSNNGSAGTVTNHGTIIAPGGYAALAGPQVFNHGVIVANAGVVALAAGDRVTLDMIGDGLIGVSVDQAALNALATNTGTIEAESGKVLLTARSANALLDTVVNAGGTIRASSLIERDGEIILDGGTSGTTQITGTVDARDVTAQGATIFGGLGSAVVADNLTTSSISNTTLTGANQIERYTGSSTLGSITLVDGAALEVLGVTTNNGAISLTADSLTNSGAITNSGGANANVILSADAFNLAGASVQAGSSAVALRPRTGTNSFGIESAGATTVSNADIASIQTDNFIIFGSSTGTIFTGNMTIGENARVEGNGKNLAFSRSLAPSAEMITIGGQGVATTGDVIIGAGGGGIRSNGGTVTGDEVVLRATNGIGTPTARVKTAANALALNNAGGAGVFVSELDHVTLRTISLNAGGPFTVSNINNGSVSLISGGDVNVAGLVSSAGSMILDAGGNLHLDGTAVDAVLVSNGGQTVTARSINMTAANGRRANIENVNGNQTVTATAGGISLQVPGGFGVAQIVNTSNLFPGDQTVSAAGQIDVLGGVISPTGSRNSGILKNGPGGLQTVRASGITLQGASTGTSAGALISSQGNQLVDVTGGTINLRGGNGGTGNSATIGAAATGQQTIRAHDINLSNGFGGTDTIAGIVGGDQLIDATGHVTLTAQGSLVSPSATALPGVRIGAPGGSSVGTDLTLLVGGNLVLNGGTAANNGASIGSSGAGVAQQNTIVVDAGGSVILNSGTAPGTGARIGSSSENGLAGGNISIKAGGAIELNGAGSATAIRTLGNVTLEAASISQSLNGFILADTLSMRTSGAASLTGPNDVARFNATSGGPLIFVDAGGLRVTGVSTTNDTITLTTDSLINEGLITNGGGTSTANIVLNADAFNLAGGTVEGGAAAVIVRPRTGSNSFGIEAAGQTTLTNADIANIHTTDFVVFGSGMGTTFTGNMTIGENARVEGGGKNLAFFRSSAPGGTTTIGSQGVSTTGNVIVSAGGGAIISNGGVVSGDQVQLRASQGIGAQFARVQTAAGRLAVNTGGPGAFVSELNDVTLGNVNLAVGGIANNVTNTTNGGGAYDLTAGGSITVSDLLQAGSVSLRAFGGSVTEVGAGAIVADTLTTSSSLDTVLTGANQVSAMNASSGGDIAIANAGNLTVTSLFATTADFDNQGAMTVSGFWNTQGSTSISTIGAGADLTVTGTLLSAGPTVLDIDGTLRVAAGGTQNAFLQSSGGQDITARAVEVSARDGRIAQIVNFAGDQTVTATAGGVDVQASNSGSNASIHNTGVHQTVNATGGVRLLSQASGGGQIGNAGSGDQSINVAGGGLSIIAEGGFSGIAVSSLQGGNQRISVAGGDGIDMRSTGGGSASLAQTAAGRSQTLLVTDADHISLNGVSGNATISANRGTQTVSITGSGANAIALGSAGATGFSQMAGGSTQNVTAGAEGQSGSITITGSDANSRFAGLSTQTAVDGTQSVSTSGVLRVTGGNASAQTLNAGLFHAGSGAQTVNAARIELHGGAAGNNNGALIVSGNGAQSIDVSGDLVIAGGAGGNAGISGPAARLQTIRAANIHMTNSAAGGFNSVGFILGGHQNIGVTGDLTMTARASGGDLPGVRIGGLAGAAATATDLVLTVGGDLVLTGGTVAGNGVGIGSTAAPGTGFANNITIDAGGDVILASGVAGAAARIGRSATTDAAAGDIRITAGGDIRLNGVAENAAIRTLGNVTLDAASISEAERGLIEAGTLHTRTSGDALLTGANRVSSFSAESDHGNVALTNTSAVLSLGSMDLPGNLAIVQTGDVAVGSATATSATLISAAGELSMSASGQILVRGSDTTFGAGSAVLAGGDLAFSAGDVTLLAGNAALTPVVVRGGDGVEMTLGNELRVTGGRGLLSPALLASGGDIELTIGRAVRVDAGTGLLSVARVQTETKDGVIRLVFPELSHGGYFVNGVEGRISQGQTGFYSVLKPAKVGKTLLLEYGD